MHKRRECRDYTGISGRRGWRRGHLGKSSGYYSMWGIFNCIVNNSYRAAFGAHSVKYHYNDKAVDVFVVDPRVPDTISAEVDFEKDDWDGAF